jgi:hypothetical protein
MDFHSVERLERVKRLKKWLERIAFASLFVDICISIVTLVSINLGRAYTTSVIYLLNYVLTAIVALSITVFAAIFMLSHYDGILDTLLLRHLKLPKIKQNQKRLGS